MIAKSHLSHGVRLSLKRRTFVGRPRAAASVRDESILGGSPRSAHEPGLEMWGSEVLLTMIKVYMTGMQSAMGSEL